MKEKYIAQYKNKNEFFKGNTSDVLGTKTLYASLKNIIKDTYNYYFETKDRDFILTLAVNNGDYIIETIVWENGGIVEENPKETFITEVFDEKKEKFISIPDGIIDVTGYSKNGAEATAENLYRKINSTYPESGVDNEDDTFYDLPEPNIQYGIYFELEDGDEISVEDGDYDFQKYYNTEEEALAAMKKILKDPKVKADRNIVGIHSVFLVDEDEWDEDPEGNYNTYGYEPYELVDRIDKEEFIEENFKSNDKYSVLREALDKLDEEDNREKINVRAKIKNLRSKLR